MSETEVKEEEVQAPETLAVETPPSESAAPPAAPALETPPAESGEEDFFAGTGIEIDSRNIPPLLQPIYKQMQAGFTKKMTGATAKAGEEASAKYADYEQVLTERNHYAALLGNPEVAAAAAKLVQAPPDEKPVTRAEMEGLFNADRAMQQFIGRVGVETWNKNFAAVQRHLPTVAKSGMNPTQRLEWIYQQIQVPVPAVGNSSVKPADLPPAPVKGGGDRSRGGQAPPGDPKLSRNATREERIKWASDKTKRELGLG